MRRLGKWLGRALLAIIIVAALGGLWKREEIARLLAVNSLFTEEKIVANFSNMGGAFLSSPVSRGTAPVSALPRGNQIILPAPAEQWIKDQNVTSFLVLKNGEIRHESYHLGTEAADLRISWSIAKSFLSVLFGIVLEEGHIASIDDPVVKYAPALIGSAYDEVSIRDVLTMQTGVVFDEDYLDKSSDINRMGRVLALGKTMDDFAAGLTETEAPPGERWKYVSIDTHVIGMVIRGATGSSIADLLSEKLIEPLGMEAEPYYLTDGVGVAFVLGGLNMRTRDYARFGQMVAQDGMWQGTEIVPKDWLRESTRAQALTEPGKRQYGYQWWQPKDAREGEFFGHGIYSQYLYIDRPNNVVIVATSANRNFRDAGVYEANIDLFRQISNGFN